MHVSERLEAVETRLRTVEKEFDTARRTAKRTKEEFESIKETRLELFNKAFTHISDNIGPVYKELTRSSQFPLGGQA